MGHRRDRGFFRDPRHAEQERVGRNEEDDAQWRKKNQNDENEEEGKELKHLKLVFPSFTEGDDTKS